MCAPNFISFHFVRQLGEGGNGVERENVWRRATLENEGYFRRLPSRSVLDCGCPLPLFIRTPFPVDRARGLAQSTTLRAFLSLIFSVHRSFALRIWVAWRGKGPQSALANARRACEVPVLNSDAGSGRPGQSTGRSHSQSFNR